MSGKNVLVGFSRILAIQKNSGGRLLDPTWKMGYMEWALILQNFSSHHHYQPAGGGAGGGGGEFLILER